MRNSTFGSARVFEQVATELLIEMATQHKLPFTFTSIGKWWYKNNEIDLIALDREKHTATFIETKWSKLDDIDCKRILQDLKIKSQNFKLKYKKENYAVIAKSITNKEKHAKQGQLLFDLKDIEQEFEA